jgi:hypothetical protein
VHIAPPIVDLGAGQSFRDELGAEQSSSYAIQVSNIKIEFYGNYDLFSAN